MSSAWCGPSYAGPQALAIPYWAAHRRRGSNQVKGARGLRDEDGFPLNGRIRDSSVQLGTLRKRVGLHLRKRQFPALDQRRQRAEDPGRLPEAQLERIQADQARLVVIEVHQVEIHLWIGTGGDRDLASAKGERADAFLEHRAP